MEIATSSLKELLEYGFAFLIMSCSNGRRRQQAVVGILKSIQVDNTV